MGAFDFDRFNGFVKQSLDNLLFGDLWRHDIFNESDMHSAAYFYVRDYFRKHERDGAYVRCEPQLARMKPDIVVYENGRPTYALELKMFTKPNFLNEEAIDQDLNKLAEFAEKIPSFKWGFFLMIYDAEEPYRLSDSRLRRAGFGKVSMTAINARRTEDSGRRRRGYDEWRAAFDKHQIDHREHA
jgi:hypothetical protein